MENFAFPQKRSPEKFFFCKKHLGTIGPNCFLREVPPGGAQNPRKTATGVITLQVFESKRVAFSRQPSVDGWRTIEYLNATS
jgi:hypothetical protein